MAEPSDWSGLVPEEYRPIFEKYMVDWAKMFADKCADYTGDDGAVFKHLGSKGQFSDINRKYWKLKSAVWEGHPMVGEDVPEMVNDVISHCFLLLLCWDEEHEAPPHRKPVRHHKTPSKRLRT